MPTSAEAAAPTVTITPPSGTQTAAFDVTITFSEDVTGFEKGDIGLTNGASVMDLTGSDDSYTATIKPKVTGDITISVGANVATNTGGEGNTAATNQTVSVDLPHSIMIMGPSGDEDRNAAFDITVMFTESVGAFVADDITLTPSTMATVGTPSGSAPTYTVTITPEANQDGELSIQIGANAVQDSSSVNYGTASNTITVDIDNVRPTVSSITGPSGAQNDDFDVTITFSEEVDNFTPSDLTVSGDADAPSSWTTGADGSTSFTGTIDISGVSTGNSNSVGISVGSNVAEDAAGNGNAASASTVDLTVTVDNKKPTPTLGSVTGTKNADFIVSITFDESVSNFAKSDIIPFLKVYLALTEPTHTTPGRCGF
ncbi:MAG: Ig-like domain-containing protein [Candidatus Poribacteria bacterium]|nr:Ig-like domain-containing protein [Candidatus Poribacteria bacterium]